MFTNKKREGINSFVFAVSLYVIETPKASSKDHELPLPIISFGIVACGFGGQPFSKQLYLYEFAVQVVARTQNCHTLPLSLINFIDYSSWLFIF